MRHPIRSAFTLIELLVVIGIIAVLVGLLLPAIQKVREAANRIKCQNNLKQIALAAHNYHDQFGAFPIGVTLADAAGRFPDGRFTDYFVELLPFLEQGNVHNRWDYANPYNNVGGPTKPAAFPVPQFVCPTADIRINPAGDFGVTTYGANAGTWAFPQPDPDATVQLPPDGMFWYAVGPNKNQTRITDVTDGTSGTLLFGERIVGDAGLDSFGIAEFDPPDTLIRLFPGSGSFVGWAVMPRTDFPGYEGAGIMLSGGVALNSQHPPYIPPPPPPPPPLPPPPPPPPIPWDSMKRGVWVRLQAFGGPHPAGVNFAMADGSVRTVPSTIKPPTLAAMGTRNGGEVVSDE